MVARLSCEANHQNSCITKQKKMNHIYPTSQNSGIFTKEDEKRKELHKTSSHPVLSLERQLAFKLFCCCCYFLYFVFALHEWRVHKRD